ncbi:MAG: RNA polymerase sigma factor [Verrucomicrobiota bacterium]
MTAFSANPGIESLLVTPGGLTSSHPAAFPDTQECRLIRRAQAGDPGAFRSLVEAHQEMIHRLCVQWLQCEDDAREACQDTFLKAWQALPAWQPRGKLSTWLYQIAINQCRDRAKSKSFRQRRTTVPFSSLTSLPACPQPPPDVAAARTGDMEKLQSGLALLPEASRIPLILCAIEGLSYQEAATVLSCSRRALEGRLYRARQLLIEWWNQQP